MPFTPAWAKVKKEWRAESIDGAAARLFETSRLDRYGVLSSDALGGGRFRQYIETDPLVLWHCFALASWCEISLGDGPEALRALIAV